jgi:hypothetical protein
MVAIPFGSFPTFTEEIVLVDGSIIDTVLLPLFTTYTPPLGLTAIHSTLVFADT